MTTYVQFDLVDEMQWEDRASEEGLFVSLELAGFEEESGHTHGYHHSKGSNGSIYEYTEWFYDGDESAFSIA
jgi:hypothetical protein